MQVCPLLMICRFSTPNLKVSFFQSVVGELITGKSESFVVEVEVAAFSAFQYYTDRLIDSIALSTEIPLIVSFQQFLAMSGNQFRKFCY